MPKKPAKKKKKLSIAKFEVTDTTLEAQFNDIDISGKISRDYGSPSNRLWGYSGVITAHSGGITSSLRLTSVGYPTLAAAQKSVADLRESFTPIALMYMKQRGVEIEFPTPPSPKKAGKRASKAKR